MLCSKDLRAAFCPIVPLENFFCPLIFYLMSSATNAGNSTHYHLLYRMFRARYDEHPKCDFTEGRLHFAAHVRMGDRRAFQPADREYFERLENIMDKISVEVVSKGLPEPMFHVFSETEVPCPSGQPSAFDEFPMWHISAEEVRVRAVNDIDIINQSCDCWSSFGVAHIPSVGVARGEYPSWSKFEDGGGGIYYSRHRCLKRTSGPNAWLGGLR